MALRKAFSFILIVISLTVNGQNHFIGIKGTVYWTGLNTCPFDKNNSGLRTLGSNILSDFNQPQVTGGINYEYLIKKHFSFSVELTYNSHYFTRVVNHSYRSNGHTYVDYNKERYNFDYLRLPLEAGFHIGKKVYFFLNIGIVPSLLTQAKETIPLVSPSGMYSENETINIIDKLSQFEIAGLIEEGLGYKFLGRYAVFASFSFQRSFMKTMFRNYEHKLSLGFKYALHK